jgi:hypothetical protein
MRALSPWLCLSAALLLAAGGGVRAAAPDDDKPDYPTTEFAEGAKSATVTAGDVTATVSLVRGAKPDPDKDGVVLRVTVGGKPVAETKAVDSGSDVPEAEASIAEIDPTNKHPEVYFTAYSGGAHCCSSVIVATEVGDKWQTVKVGEFDGGGDYLEDIDGDGIAEIVTVDNRFLYTFDCYACSAAPLTIYTVRAGAVIDVSTDPRFLPAHRDWLAQIEDTVDPKERWKSPGFLAGWVATRIRLGEGAAAWKELNTRWNFAKDAGEEVCPIVDDPDKCSRKVRKVMKFPERLKLFLDQNGYTF